jgi:hypothetical protein
METAFRAILFGAAGVTALAGTRINWGAHPQGAAYPAAVLMRVSDAESYTLDGRDGLSKGRVQVDCYGMEYKAARDLAAAIRAVLSGYRGGNFSLIEHAATRDSREGGTNEAERPYRVSMDFLTHWRAT